MRDLILHMIQRNPDERWTAHRYLTDWGPQLFPAYLTNLLHPFFASILDADVDMRVSMLEAAFPRIVAGITEESHPASSSRQDEPAASGHTNPEETGQLIPEGISGLYSVDCDSAHVHGPSNICLALHTSCQLGLLLQHSVAEHGKSFQFLPCQDVQPSPYCLACCVQRICGNGWDGLAVCLKYAMRRRDRWQRRPVGSGS